MADTANKRIMPALIIAAVMSFTCGALAQAPSERTPRPSIRVIGEAAIPVKPDQAQIDIAVVTQAQLAQTAATENAQRLNAVLADLRNALASSGDIKTIGYSVNPDYHYPKGGGSPTITGYTATNLIQVKVNDLSLVGKAIDTATQSGANKIQRLRFTLKDERSAQTQALREAATKARGKAEALAAALNVKISRILLVEEGGSAVTPRILQQSAELRAGIAAAPTPIEPGEIEVRATVILTVEIAP